jgi:DNA-nicking Smr family endonuclease
MKKQKPEERPAGDFKTNPFKALKRFAPQPVPKEKKQAMPPIRPGKEHQEEDDTSLFLRSVEGARRITSEPGSALPRAEQKSEAKPHVDPPEDVQLFLEAMQKIGTTFTPAVSDREEDGEERRTATSRTKQLRRGTISISETLDLHGYVKDEALQRLARFISGAYHRGSKAVLVITGKGLNSPEGPVLQGSVDAWLREQGKSMVIEVAQAPRDKGGSGAVVVFLRTNRTDKSGASRTMRS